MLETKIDFVAKLYFLTPEQGGRIKLLKSGCRPVIKFSHHNYLTSCEQQFIGQDSILPGEKVDANIRILATDVFKGYLNEGTLFQFFDGSRILGFGEILQIINLKLQTPDTT